jgi:DNA-binding transcriptional regulator YiaG
MKKGMTVKEKDAVLALGSALRLERGAKVKGFTRFAYLGPVSRTEVKAVRRMLHQTQAAFAGYLGVSARLVQAWEQGWRTPEPLPSKVMRAIKEEPRFVEVLARY